MTCIVGIAHNGKVWLAGDRRASNGHTYSKTFRSKVFIKDNFVFGYTSSFTLGTLLEFYWKPPEQEYNQSDDDYINVTVRESLTNLFKDNDYGEKKNGEYSSGTFIMGWKGRLFTHHDNGFFLESVADSVGSGSEAAMGALTALTLTNYHLENNVEEMLKICIASAGQLITTVSECCDILSL